MLQLSVKDLMTKVVVFVNPETPLIEAVDILLRRNFTGLPVVDKENKVIGIITEQDLILKGSSIHLPTLMKLLEQFDIYSKDKESIRGDIKKILKMKVIDIMNPAPLTLLESASIEEAVTAFSEHHKVNPIPILDCEGRLAGILSRFDLIKLFGASRINLNESSNERVIDKNVEKFISDFESRFVMVSKYRTYYWLIFSLTFAILGFFIAFAIILDIR